MAGPTVTIVPLTLYSFKLITVDEVGERQESVEIYLNPGSELTVEFGLSEEVRQTRREAGFVWEVPFSEEEERSE